MTIRVSASVPILFALSLVASGHPAPDRAIVVPFRISANFAVVTARIDGSDIPLVFDSGSPAPVSLSQAALDRVRAIATGERSRGVDAKGNVIEYPKYKIRRIEIGSAVFTDVIGELDAHDPSYQATAVGQEGFLGTALLKTYKVIVDYPKRRITLIPPGASRSGSNVCKGSAVPLSPAWDGEPATDVETDLGRLVMWWDTGSPISVMSRRFVERAQPGARAEAVISKRVSFGGTDFGPFRFEIADLSLPAGFDGFVGYNFFAKHIVCFDFPQRRLLIGR